MIKKYLALAACLVLAATAFTSCSGDTSSSSSAVTSAADSQATGSEASTQNVDIPTKLVINGEEVTDTDSLVMCTVGGFDISFDEFRYYWLTYKDRLKTIGYDVDANTAESVALLKYQVINELVSTYGIMAYARDNDVAYTISQTELETEYMQQLMNYQTESQYIQFLKERNLTDDAMQSTLNSYLASNVAYSSLFGEDGGKFYVAPDSVKEVLNSDDAIRCVEIFIPFSTATELSDEEKEGWDEKTMSGKLIVYDTAYGKLDSDAKEETKKKASEIAQQVCEKAKKGEDFYKLMEQYNYESTLFPKEGQTYSDVAGYYLTDEYTSYTEEFRKAAFALKDNEVSDVIANENDGYHIIMRLPKDSEYIESNISSLTEEYNTSHAAALFAEYCEDIEITYSDIYDELDIDSIS